MWGVLFRVYIGLIYGGGGVGFGILIGRAEETTNTTTWALSLGIGGYVLGYLLAPYIGARPWRWARRRILLFSRLMPLQAVVAAAIGLAFALVISALLALPLSMLPDPWGQVTPFIAAVFLCIIFVPIMVLQGRSVLQFFFNTSPGVSTRREATSDQVILDTSAIIDGRVADVIRTGFVQGTILIPRFVLDELRHIADSSDPMRRNRGRRGLEMLTQLQRESDVPVQISDIDFHDTLEVDSKLIKLAKTLRCAIVSNDFNLNRVAGLEGVKMLNINALANAVKPVVMPGEDMTLRIVQEGKEQGQGVGFLDDGTMVVVEGGRRYLNTDLNVAITRVLQTSAGRMIFAQPKANINAKAQG
ncbi:MAG: PIN domain-containing protein [Dehalococcoidia bacterium]